MSIVVRHEVPHGKWWVAGNYDDIYTGYINNRQK